MRTSEVRPIASRGALAVRAAHALAASADIETLQRILGLDHDEPGPAVEQSRRGPAAGGRPAVRGDVAA
ncbi:hypothetical protein ABT026_20780 [Streptomyces sp. NPDC002734]|uniref:hypothetical protein n=1 Tax=Streptomyces sp. NPDC002734 TaxID=3154426 RepID=UPI003319722C